MGCAIFTRESTIKTVLDQTLDAWMLDGEKRLTVPPGEIAPLADRERVLRHGEHGEVESGQQVVQRDVKAAFTAVL